MNGERFKSVMIIVVLPLVLLLVAFAWRWSHGGLLVVKRTPTPTTTPVAFEESTPVLDPAISQHFSINDISNLDAIAQTYGVTFSAQDKQRLASDKFVVKNLLDTNIRPDTTHTDVDWQREFASLYNAVRGPLDYKERQPANALFLSADSFLNSYSVLFAELLKETENKQFYPAMKTLTQTLYEAAQQHVASNSSDQHTWLKVRNYLAVPYSLLSAAVVAPTTDDYFKDGETRSPEEIAAAFTQQDKDADSVEKVTAFVKNLHLDPPSEQVVLADLQHIYDAKDAGMPAMFTDEYQAYAEATNIQFKVDFTQFTPRGTYTGSSVRRQYFRSMMWFNQVPFFLKSQPLTSYAFALSSLLKEHPDQLAAYQKVDNLVSLLVGTSDDLTPLDYATAGSAERLPHKQPQIKNLPAQYPSVGTVQSADVLAATAGMRFFSGKFILDSYWTGQLTQGDEAPRPGFTQKLPPMASSLEVMSLLGSQYATEHIPKLDFYTKDNSQAITQMLAQLKQEAQGFDTAYWQQNVYSSSLWTIQGLFSWFQQHRQALPEFMQSPRWDAKTVLTASGFWTELRHATLLYAKQSFAERGGGGDELCDTRKVPDAPKSYIEPQPQAYDRLLYVANKTMQAYGDQSGDLKNLSHLQNFIDLMTVVRDYSTKELANTTLQETVLEHHDPDPQDPTKTCISYSIEGDSEWEILRRKVVDMLIQALPEPVEGPILPAKDKRAALVADVHTGGDSATPTQILYEGVGVPRVIFVAVKDANGPRLTVGFTYSHYEFTAPYGGQRLTDEAWQKQFYQGDDTLAPFDYTPKSSWPAPPSWYADLLGGK